MSEDKIVIDIPRNIYDVQEIIFNGEVMPINMNRVSSISLRITAAEPVPKLDIAYLGFRLEDEE